MRVLLIIIIIAAVLVVTLSSLWGLSSPQVYTVSLPPPVLGGRCLPREGGGFSCLKKVSRTLLSSAWGSQHRQGPQLGFILILFTQLRDMSIHLGILLVCWSCVGREINTLGIELKLVTETNSIHSIVIHSFKNYFLRPIVRQMPSWG